MHASRVALAAAFLGIVLERTVTPPWHYYRDRPYYGRIYYHDHFISSLPPGLAPVRQHGRDHAGKAVTGYSGPGHVKVTGFVHYLRLGLISKAPCWSDSFLRWRV